MALNPPKAKAEIIEDLLQLRAAADPDDKDAGYTPAVRILSYVLQGVKRERTGDHAIEHPIRVASRFPDSPVHRTIALLHDLIEDTRNNEPEYRWMIGDLEKLRFSPRVVAAVHALTRGIDDESESYLAFIQRCSANPDAVLGKIADLEDNMKDILADLKAKKRVSAGEKERVRKYTLCKAYLEAVRDEPSLAGTPVAEFAYANAIVDPVTERPFASWLKDALLEKYSLPKDEEKNIQIPTAFSRAAKRAVKAETSGRLPSRPRAMRMSAR